MRYYLRICRVQSSTTRVKSAQTLSELNSVAALTLESQSQQQLVHRLLVSVKAEIRQIRESGKTTEPGNTADSLAPAGEARPSLTPVVDRASDRSVDRPLDRSGNLKLIRDLFEQMRSEETFLLHDRQEKAQDEARIRNWTFAGMEAAVLVALGLSYALVLEFEAHVRRGERDLQNAKQAADSASQFKSTFLASMSHEIRTPLTAIIGFADLLARPTLSDADRQNFLQKVRRNGSHLLNIINDILDLSKIEAGRMEIERVNCSPVQTVTDAVSLLSEKANEKGVVLDVQYVGSCPETIRTDPTRLRQILTNLLANAIKFTDRGGAVRLAVELVPSLAHGEGRIQFRITDTGVGMTDEQVKRLFQPFAQADSSTTRKFGGTGLGLTISRQFAQMLGGEITVASQSGIGSAFTVEVETGPMHAVRLFDAPRVMAEVIDEPAEVVGNKLNGKILLAEDGLTNQELIGLHLREAGAEVVMAENGRIACERVAEAKKAHAPFDLILMDMEMPEMDGCQATMQLRNSGVKAPIIALTANAMSADRDHCMTAGCNAFVTKPIDWPRLMDLIESHLKRKNDAIARERDPHLARVLQTFMRELDQLSSSLRHAMDLSDRLMLAQVAHSIKGTAGNCGFSALAESAAELEQTAKDTSPSETVTKAATNLLDLCNRTKRAA